MLVLEYHQGEGGFVTSYPWKAIKSKRKEW
jgi:hypothetical protein